MTPASRAVRRGLRSIPCAAVLTVLTAGAALAQETAAEISKKSRERGALNLVNLSAEMKLSTTSADGKVKEQVLTTSSKSVGGRNHALSRFILPASVAGVAFLTVEGGPGEPDEISLYLPKLKRVRKVARTERGKAFMDTDFSYADIASNGARDEDNKRLPDEKVDGREVFVLVGRGGEESPYGEVKLYVDKQTWVPMKVEYADKGGKPFKRYRTLKLKAFKDRTIAAESLMENLQAGTRTQLTVLKLEDAAASDDAYTERALERG